MQRLLVVLVSVLIVANAHAVLKAPKPWNTAASKSNPCGGGSAPTAAAAQWVVGQQVDITWQVQAGDGTGAVNIIVNGAGGNTFTGQGTKIGDAGSVTTFTFKFTVPNVQCTGANGLCTVQVKSSSNWFSCTSVKISSTAAPAPVPAPVPTPAASTRQQQPATSAQQQATSAQKATSAQQQATSAQQTRQQGSTKEAIATTEVAQTQAPTPGGDTGIQSAICTVMTGLKFCSMANGRNVSFTSGDNPDNVDAAVRSTFGETLNNPLVFGTPKADGCEDALKNLLCGNALPLCGDKVACQPHCREAIAKCGLQDSHKGLFDCTQGSPTECLGSNVAAVPETEANSVSKVFVGASIVLALLM